MDALNQFKALERLAAGNNLDADELRLYLLLLANCRGSRNGQIAYTTIKSAIDSELSPGKLKKACQRLLMGNLVVVTSPFPERINEENFILSYLIPLTGES
jgi:hypothetical protein